MNKSDQTQITNENMNKSDQTQISNKNMNKSGLSVYVATRFGNRVQARSIMTELERMGMRVSHDWTHSDNTDDDLVQVDREYLRHCAEVDVVAVKNSDLVVVLFDTREGPYNGTLVEIGVAVGAGVPVFIWNPENAQDKNIFLELEQVEQFERLTDVLSKIKESSSVKQKRYIAISGKMASGKSTLMQKIVSHAHKNGLTVETVSIASYLKDLCHREFGMSLEEHKKDRDLLIKVGRALRAHNLNVFVDEAMRKVGESKADLVIIDDLRFKNEADVFKRNGFKILRLDASEDCRRTRIHEKYGDSSQKHFDKMTDPTETDLDTYDFNMRVNSENDPDTVLNDTLSHLRI